jgi:phosphotransacetylase
MSKYDELLARCASIEPIPTAVVHPCEATALSGAIEAGQKKLIVPILVGPAAKIRETAAAAGVDIGSVEIVDVPHSHAAAAKAVELVRNGKAEVLMKGSLHTDELLGAVVARETGLRTGRRISHVFIMDVPTYHKVLIITTPRSTSRRRSRTRPTSATPSIFQADRLERPQDFRR